MSLPSLAVILLVGIAVGYRLYSRFVARQYGLDDTHLTPACEMNDGVDYVPTKPFYLLGQHFSAIAAAGPIAGPIMAAQIFGWLPCLLWIGLGTIFIGAVHDFSSLAASVKHRARSIAEIVRLYLGQRGWLAMMLFIWLALIYVIVAFTDITASTFVGKTEEFEGETFAFNPGGAVAAASTMYLLLAVLMGLIQRRFDPPLWLQTIIFVPATLGVVWFGTKISTLLILDVKMWGVLILAYCFAASLLPMWLLLQPRGYLGGFILYLTLFVGLIGIFFGGFQVEQESFKTWRAPGMTGALFPFLFVTIACGACSGFHGLVCSGTTSKQIEKESHCRPVGYGAMLLEGFVAFIALATVMIVAQPQLQGMAPGKIYGDGIGRFLAILIGPEHLRFAMTFGAMAFSTFVFDTLDVSTRLSRYIIQELFNWSGKKGAMLATALTIALPLFLIMRSGEGAYRLFWTLFGTGNQLLAALTLLGITVWLKRSARPTWFALFPMLFVMTMTIWSLVIQAREAYAVILQEGIVLNTTILNGVVSVSLLCLAAILIIEALRALAQPVMSTVKAPTT
ncbi:MAG: carbon starvation protein A [Candidatus Methylomirabilis oxygeniifera]|uniref:Carbon starvation protein A n=1 Tax=Methylomirabilis oxygeniifera TaxID=671143 RepID=D5MHK7_METO1|nr:MAG: carbon starvation protein A [Candidatus Methylomirabilis oxyfera]CBE67140.1 Carbon starvation protein A [Candidatus Methylomirabilis oxyfera]